MNLVEFLQIVLDWSAILYGFHCLLQLLPRLLSVVLRQLGFFCEHNKPNFVHTVPTTVIPETLGKWSDTTGKKNSDSENTFCDYTDWNQQLYNGALCRRIFNGIRETWCSTKINIWRCDPYFRDRYLEMFGEQMWAFCWLFDLRHKLRSISK